ncbi:MAG: peptidase [Pseudomonadota bacterium]
MTYCVAIALNAGLVFAADSRTNAGVDQVQTHSKMFTFGIAGERQFVILSSGNLATTQSVIAELRHHIESNSQTNLLNVGRMQDAADYVGGMVRDETARHAAAVSAAGFNAETTLLFGGQIAGRDQRLFLIYPQGNHIACSEETPYMQIGETKYGKPILDRVVTADTSIEEASLCAMVSLDSTMRSNASVGPPVELLTYVNNSFVIDRYLRLEGDDPQLLGIRQGWNEQINRAFHALPALQWDAQMQKTPSI